MPLPDSIPAKNAAAAAVKTLPSGIARPVILQDLDWSGPGLAIETILRVAEAVPVLQGVKVETTSAGPKYCAIREASCERLHVSGGWAVTQMIDGLSRGVDAFMPEASMVRIYRAIWDAFHAGDQARATGLFERLAPILSFSNQHIDLSIQFFKLVLQRRGIFTTTVCRGITRELNTVERADADRFAKEVVALLGLLGR